MFVCFFQALVSGGVDSTVCAALLHKVILLFAYYIKQEDSIFAVGLKSNRTPGCQKCGENISDALSCALCAAS